MNKMDAIRAAFKKVIKKSPLKADTSKEASAKIMAARSKKV